MKYPITYEEFNRLTCYTLRRMNVPGPYDDHLQEAYFVYLKTLQRYNPSKSKFSTFFVYQLRHHYKTLFRNEQQSKDSLARLQEASETSCTMPQEHLLLTDFFDQLTIFERDIVKFAYDGYTVYEIAKLKKVSESTIKRTRKKIKQKLQPHIV